MLGAGYNTIKTNAPWYRNIPRGVSYRYRGDLPGERWLLRQDHRPLRHVLSLGINFFDTANGYSAGTLRSKTNRIEMRDMEIVRRIQELAEGHGSKMQQIALAWHWAKGVASPIVGGTKMSHYDDAADALDVTLTPEEVVYLEELYLPHRVVGAVDHNPPEGVMLPDEKK